MPTRRLLTVLTSAAVVVLLAALAGCEPPPVEGKQVGNICPEIAGLDADGNVIRLSEFRGKVVLVNFWGIACGPCRAMIPHEREMVTGKYKDRPFVLLGVAQDRPEELKEFQKFVSMPWPNIADGTQVLGRQWNVQVVPTAILVDHRGVILEKWEGVDPGMWAVIDKAVRKAENQ